MNKLLKLIETWTPVVLSIWIVVMIAIEDYVKATYLIAFVGVLLITNQLERIVDNTDLTNITIHMNQRNSEN